MTPILQCASAERLQLCQVTSTVLVCLFLIFTPFEHLDRCTLVDTSESTLFSPDRLYHVKCTV
jgi:hypothetical protein